MPFHRYPSLTKPSDKSEFDQLLKALADLPCRVDEKVHGANVSVEVDETIRTARRSDFLGEDENFYGFQKMMADRTENLQALRGDDERITVFGEIYGRGKGTRKREYEVQKMFDYGRDTFGFVVFDLAVHVGDELKFLDLDEMKARVAAAGFDVLPSLFSGTFDECREWSGANKEKQSAWGGDHVREGHVIRPVVETRLPCGRRALFKDKGEKFFEVHSMKKPKVAPVIRGEIQVDVETLMAGCTAHRFETVKSKENEDDQKNIGLMITRMRDDIFDDLAGDMVARYEAKQLTMLKRHLSKAIGSHVRGWIQSA